MSFTVAVIGGGIAGSTTALRLAQSGIKSVLFEASHSLVNGPPMCHLHAGGALYREISQEHCLKMLKQSIQTLKCYPYSANVRPTLLTVPKRDPGDPQEIINRLNFLAKAYKKLVIQDKTNQVLGDPSQYYQVFTEEEVYRIRDRDYPQCPITMEDWLIAPAKSMDLSKLKFPLIMVQEYGLSSLRTAAHANLMLEKSSNCKLMLSTKVTRIQTIQGRCWRVWYIRNLGDRHRQQGGDGCEDGFVDVQYIMNACGYQSGLIDDMVGIKQQRMLEFKAAYVTKWKECKGVWPEVIFHGKRKTPQGMGQLTPYKDNIFQIHGMTEDITLFEGGLVRTQEGSSQPTFPKNITKLLEQGWSPEQTNHRTQLAISHITAFIPEFESSRPASKPLYGGQQIPGTNPDLRTVELSCEGLPYARSEIVKASNAIEVADCFVRKLIVEFGEPVVVSGGKEAFDMHGEDVLERARELARVRGYPLGLADFY